MITVLDYGRGNLFSLKHALEHIGVPFEITSEPARVEAAERIIFPGVGAFGDAAAGLRSRRLEAPLKRAASRGVPVLGICVGCQLLLDRGEEFGIHTGMGLIAGTVRRLPDPIAGGPDAIRVPNVGWRRLEVAAHDPLLKCLAGESVYFVHSYAPMVDDQADAVAFLNINGQRTPVAVRRNNIVGVQFHPEKSGRAGLGFLRHFADLLP